MRNLTIVVAVLALIYASYWFIGASAAERSAKNLLAGMAEEGWAVSYADIETAGFPSRFDTSASDLDILTPNGQFGWAVPFMQVLALSYQPNHIIVAFPPEQTIRAGRQTLTLASETLRASASVSGVPNLPLETVKVETGPAKITSDFGWSIGLKHALLAIQPEGPLANHYKLYVDADTLLLPDRLRAALDPRGIHPPELTRMSVDATVVLDRTLDRHSLAQWELDPPHLQTITLKQVAINWGQMGLTGDGTLNIGADGYPTGKITVQVASWRDLIGILANGGLVQRGQSMLLENVAQSMAQGRQTLEVPINFGNGRISIGPIVIGPAPRFF